MITRLVFSVTIAAFLVGCYASVESFPVLVDRSDAAEGAIEVTDLGRRRTDAESLVVPLEGDRERSFRFRIAVEGDAEIRLNRGVERGSSPALAVSLEGEIAGASLSVTAGGASRRFAFDRILVPPPPEDGMNSRYRLTVPLQGLEIGPWEVEFTAPAGSAGFRVRELHFSAFSPRYDVTGDSLSRIYAADARLPVEHVSGAVRFPAAAAVVRDHTEGLQIHYEAPTLLFQDRTDVPRGVAALSGGEIGISLRPGTRSTVLRPRMHFSELEWLQITMPESVAVTSVNPISIPTDPLEPILLDLEELQNWPRELWRRPDFGLFAWSDYPAILWLDHGSYRSQSEMFTRLAFFVEKRGFQGRLLSDEELAGRHGWNAHNYRPQGLAEFFNAAESSDFALNSAELELLEIVTANSLLIEDQGAPRGRRWLPGRGGVLSISQESFPALRRLLIVHEAMHGVFYEEPQFRSAAFDYWDRVLTPREREFWQFFLSWMSYDPDDRYLMVNEFQAYVLQQQESGVNWYFGTQIAGRLRGAVPSRVESINLFLADYPRTFSDAAAAMNQALFEVSGMRGGNPFGLELP